MEIFREVKEAITQINPTKKQLRVFGIVAAVFIFAVFIKSGFQASFSLIVPLVLILLAIFAPKSIMPFWLTLIVLAIPIGWFVSRLVLALFFFTVITGVSLVLRMLRSDLLGLKMNGEQKSYWEPFEENKNPDTMAL